MTEKPTIADAVRTVGHLLEHRGITGPFAVSAEGLPVAPIDRQAFGWCMIGAIDAVSSELFGSQGSEVAERAYLEVRKAVLRELPEFISRGPVYAWEDRQLGPNSWERRGTTSAERLAIAKRLQAAK